MGDGIYAALSGAIAQNVALETTATNLANTDTAGFRAMQPEFEEVMQNKGRQAKGPGAAGAPHFTAVRRTTTEPQPGSMRTTGSSLDVAVGPTSFLAVRTPAGERYTRAGALHLAADRTLVTSTGLPVLSDRGEPIVAPADASVELTADADVQADGSSLAHLRLVTFKDPRMLTYEGQNLLAQNQDSGPPTVSGEPLRVGELEQSNVSAVRAISDLVLCSRVFEAMQRAITTFRDIDQRLVADVPK